MATRTMNRERLALAWAAREKDLPDVDARIVVEAWTEEVYDPLAIAYVKQDWTTYLASRQGRICLVKEESTFGEGHETECRPIVDCPIDLQIEMLGHFAALLSEAEKIASDYAEKIEAALS